MGWSLQERGSSQGAVRTHQLALRHEYIVSLDPRNKHLDVIATKEFGNGPNGRLKLAGIAALEWGIKLEALHAGVKVAPALARLGPTGREEYQLKPASGNRVEIIFVREKDRIYFGLVDCGSLSLTLAYTSDVQVASSGVVDAATVTLQEPAEHQEKGKVDDEKIEQEAETDDDDLNDTTVTPAHQSKPEASSLISRSTPLPSLGRTDIVQETPTTGRVIEVRESAPALVLDKDVPTVDTHENTPPGEADTEKESYSTAKMQQRHSKEIDGDTSINGSGGASADLNDNNDIQETSDASGADRTTSDDVHDELRHDTLTLDRVDQKNEEEERKEDSEPVQPQRKKPGRPRRTANTPMTTKAGTKRATPTADLDSDGEPTPRLAKRSKKGDDESQESRHSTINVDIVTRKPPLKQTYRKGNRTIEKEASPLPSTSARLSQVSVAEEDLYTGPKPKVVFSNSGITEKSSFMKFLTNHGGKKVDGFRSGESGNILCVKPGPLLKSMKLLCAIGLGVPIVTDHWLIESAKATRFLKLNAFVPSVPTQEKDWGFQMADIWGQAQDKLFEGKVMYFTPALKDSYSDFRELQEVCRTVGARRSLTKAGKDLKGGKDMDDTIVLALDERDKDAVVIAENGHTCYSKDLLTTSILRGQVDLDSDEFKITPVSSQTLKKRGRPRKS